MFSILARVRIPSSASIVPRRVTLDICLASESNFGSNTLLLEVVGPESEGLAVSAVAIWAVGLAAPPVGGEGAG